LIVQSSHNKKYFNGGDASKTEFFLALLLLGNLSGFLGAHPPKIFVKICRIKRQRNPKFIKKEEEGMAVF